jgi:hypothetical protein
MRGAFRLLLILLIISGCKQESDISEILKFSAIECYDQLELIDNIFEADSILKAKRIDSLNRANPQIAENVELLSEPPLALNPIMQNYSPMIYRGNDGQPYIDTTAILGIVFDTTKMKENLQKSSSVFPKDVQWRFKKTILGQDCYWYSPKPKGRKIELSENNVESIVATKPLLDLLPIGKKNNTLAQFSIEIWIKDDFASGSYIILPSNDFIIGSIVNRFGDTYQSPIRGYLVEKDVLQLKQLLPNLVIIKE